MVANTSDSILGTIKTMLNVEPSDTAFDIDIIMHINTAIGIILEAGVGNNVRVTDLSTSWSEFVDINNVIFDKVVSYIYLKVKMLFDPPASGTISAAFEKTLDELLWRICHDGEMEALNIIVVDDEEGV